MLLIMAHFEEMEGDSDTVTTLSESEMDTVWEVEPDDDGVPPLPVVESEIDKETLVE